MNDFENSLLNYFNFMQRLNRNSANKILLEQEIEFLRDKICIEDNYEKFKKMWNSEFSNFEYEINNEKIKMKKIDSSTLIEDILMDNKQEEGGRQITEMYNRFGWAQNVDVTSDPSTIRWSRFLSDDRYAEDGVGIFEGGASYSTGVWRPSENSIMNGGTEFNAPSRAAIYRKIHKLAYGRDWQFDYEDFVQWDLKNIGLEKRSVKSNTNTYHPHLNHKPFMKVEKRKIEGGRTEINVIMN